MVDSAQDVNERSDGGCRCDVPILSGLRAPTLSVNPMGFVTHKVGGG